MYQIFDTTDLSTAILDSLAEVAIAVADRAPGQVDIAILDKLMGEEMFLPLIELDIQFSDEREALLPHVA